MNEMGGDWQARTQLLIGDASLDKLAQTHVLLAGVGGVGGYVDSYLHGLVKTNISP